MYIYVYIILNSKNCLFCGIFYFSCITPYPFLIFGIKKCNKKCQSKFISQNLKSQTQNLVVVVPTWGTAFSVIDAELRIHKYLTPI